jgi:S1-C subfamily serine protease
VRVTEVAPLGAGERAGLQPNDVIVRVGEKPVRNLQDYRLAMRAENLRQGVRLEVVSESTHHFVFLQADGLS